MSIESKDGVRQVSLKSLLICSVLLGMFLAVAAQRGYLSILAPTISITNKKQWNRSTESGKCVVFIDGGWSTRAEDFRWALVDFAASCRQRHAGIRFLILPVSTFGVSDEVRAISAGIVDSHGIQISNAENHNGSGLVVWMDDGNVIHHDWCREFVGDSYPPKSQREIVKSLKSCTKGVFGK